MHRHTTKDPARALYGDRRVTRARSAIASTACSIEGAFTVEQLALKVRRTAPRLGATATVYRAVAAMLEAGSVEKVGVREGHALYALCSASTHHHHIVCDGCGRTAHTECPVHIATTRDDGFVVTRHEVTLYGLCADCARHSRGGE